MVEAGGLENVSEEIGLNVFNRLGKYWLGQFGRRVGAKLGKDSGNKFGRAKCVVIGISFGGEFTESNSSVVRSMHTP